MTKRRADQAPVGLTSNGVLIVNILGVLNPKQAREVRACLPARLGNDWFVGVAVKGNDVERVLRRLDDAAAEAAASIAGKSEDRVPGGVSRRAKAVKRKPNKASAR